MSVSHRQQQTISYPASPSEGCPIREKQFHLQMLVFFSKKKVPFARYTSNVDAHGVIVLKLSKGTLIPPPSFTFYNAAAPENTLAGGASVRVISSISVVGFVGNGGTLTFNDIDGGESGTKLVSVDYINADFVFQNTECSNCRNSFFSVNGGDPVQVQMPISGQVSIKIEILRIDGMNDLTELG